MTNRHLKQLIENAINDLLTEMTDDDESHLVPTEKGEAHLSQGGDKRFWGNRGAGILIVARDTGRVLLVLRSQYVNEPGTWGIPGGKIDGKESPSAAVKRETREELGFSGTIDTVPAHVFKAGNFSFYNFLGVVSSEFEPTLNWENESSGWFDLNSLPSPLHFGVKSLLAHSKDDILELASSRD